MTTTFMLRVASAFSALFTIGHSIGGLQNWSPFPDNLVFHMMSAMHFHSMGGSRTYLELYTGLGWTLSVFMALQTVLLWQLASLARTNLTAARAMIIPFAVAALVCGLIAWRLIDPIPAAFSAMLLLILVVAYLAERRAPA